MSAGEPALDGHDRSVYRRGLGEDPRFNSNTARTRNRVELEAPVQAVFGQLTYAEAIDRLTEAQTALACPSPFLTETSMSNKIMYKRLGLVQRKKTLTREQFEAHWLNTHAELCKRLPGMRRYSVNLVEPGRFPHFPYDGFSELWFDSEQALQVALESPEGRTLLADLPNFVEKIEPLVVKEHPML